MKIGIDARVLMDRYYSGVSEYAANLFDAILVQDENNKYSFFYNNRRPQEERWLRWHKPNTEIRGTHYPNKVFNYFLQKIFAQPKLDRFLGGTDIFFAPHFNFLRISKKTKLIATVHDLSFLRYPEFFSVRKNFWHRALGVKKMLRRADHLVAVSQNTKEDLMELLSIPSEKISVIHSGNIYKRQAESILQNNGASNLENILQQSESDGSENILSNKELGVLGLNKITVEASYKFLERLRLRPGFILFLGNIEPRKNIQGLIEAYEMMRRSRLDLADRQLVLAGGQGWKNKKIFSAIKHSPYQQDIKLLGYVSCEEKEFLFQQAGVFAYPSFYEGFGFPPLEAMSFGLPVVSANVSSLPEVLGGAALLIDPFSTEELAEALIICLTDKEIRSRLIVAGLKRAVNFSWEKTAAAYLKLFKKIHEEK